MARLSWLVATCTATMVVGVVGCGGKKGDDGLPQPASVVGGEGHPDNAGGQPVAGLPPDFTKVNYTPVDFASLDYTKGPTGEPVEERFVTDKEAGRFIETGFTDAAGQFIRHGPRYQCYQWPAEDRKTHKPKPQADPARVKKKAEAFWLNGELHGAARRWTAQGKLVEESAFVHNKQHGVRREWHEKSGKVWKEQPYVDDVLHGIRREWHEKSGRVWQEQPYVNGTLHGVVKRWKPDGLPVAEESYANGLKHGRWTHWFEATDQIRWQAEYAQGKQHGVSTLYHPNGQKRLEATFVNGEEVENSRREWDSAGNDFSEVRRRARALVAGKRPAGSRTQKALIAYIDHQLEEFASDPKADKRIADNLQPILKSLAPAEAGTTADLLQALWVFKWGLPPEWEMRDTMKRLGKPAGDFIATLRAVYGDKDLLGYVATDYPFDDFLRVIGKPTSGYKPPVFDQGWWTYQCSDGAVRLKIVTDWSATVMLRGAQP